MAAQVLLLEDPRCLENSVAGGKAAGLAAAKSVGLPVLDGVVVPTSAAIAGLRAGMQALADRGSGGARRATMSTAIDGSLASELRAAVDTLGGDVVVRSSATVESSGEWSGAFSTFSEIGRDEVATAVRGCWTSVFGVDAIERGERVGVRPEDISMAVLVQPRIEPRVAGLARVRGTIVEIDAVAGSPAALMAGWATGQRIEVTDHDEVRAPQDCLLDVVTARDVGALARRTLNLLGHGVIEWAWTGHSVVLLQSGAAEERDEAVPVPDRVAGLDRPAACRVARLALAFPGQLCDELVLPWALGLRDPDALVRSASPAPQDFSLAEARSEAGKLAAQVWRLPVDEAVRECGVLLRGLRGSEPDAALDRLDLLAEPDMAAATALLRGLRSVGARAVQARKLHRADDIFGCGPADLSDTRSGEPRQSWKGARRWEPFLVGVAQTLGAAYHGIPASRGVGAGSARVVADPHAIPPRRRPREVIVAPTPVPALSSQLWDAAGLVTTGGSAAAHLMEVARSLGVPAVAACALPFSLASLEGALLAVDGELGMVSHWPM
jgi:phosphohistidine swiveling domain-containing protein